MPRKADTPQLNVRLEADMLAELKALSVVSGESMNALALEALQEYLWARPEAIEAGKRIMSGWSAYKNATKASKDPTGLLLAQIRGGGTATAPADASENKTAADAAAQAPGSEAQGAQAEAAQEQVPAEPAQTEQEQAEDMPQASPVPSDSGQVASSSPVDMQLAAGAQAPVPAMQDAQDSEPADMQESADTAEAGDSSQDMQDGSSMTEQLGQDATTAQGLPVQGSLLASLRRMVRENAAKDALQDAGQDEEAAGPSIEELKARARELKAQGLTQSQIAREIGKSEASVSRYLKSAK